MKDDPRLKEQLQLLYSSGYSMSEIAAKFLCSIHKVVYWMEKYKIKRRTRSQAAYLKQNPNGDPFKIKIRLNRNDLISYGLGLGIYMGEGEKVSKSAIRVANTDPKIIKLFIKFLLNICNVERNKLSYSIVCFNDNNITKVVEYWSKILEIPQEKFGKIVQIPTQGKGIYKKKSEFGVCTVTFCNMKLKSWIMREIEKMKNYAGEFN